MMVFFDTNILVYAQQADSRGETARRYLAEGGVISVQVLNELVNVLRRKLARTWPEVVDVLGDVLAVVAPPMPLTIHTHNAAVSLARDHSLSFYDALILASAMEANCNILLSEDMQHGRVFGGLTIRNPFLDQA